MSYRDKLQTIAARLFKGPPSHLESVCMGKTLDRLAERVGDLEECSEFAFSEITTGAGTHQDLAHRMREASQRGAAIVLRMASATPTEMSMLRTDLHAVMLGYAEHADELHLVCAEVVVRKPLPACLLTAARGAR